MSRKWGMDRKPTLWERVYGSAFSLVIFIVAAAFTYAASIPFWKSKEVPPGSIAVFAVAVVFLLGSGVLFSRAMFGVARKPSSLAILITGYIIIGMSVVALVLSVAGFGNSFYLVGVGLTGIAGGISIVSQSKRLGRS
ncbi:hypothetical protein [Marinimicrobium sp. ABcell2]|uniref:hypothetical protein n=1 Tax=Marinimicrobium sp. ABcell2 TaxID=3069751 RepID=UPI0027B24775|nr:hypothetical protein [Marinimicrobium sp. ABcell2]MDQ2078545.1 hypothetical protein [Marinimicrobium sp. ABcell2]